MATLAEQIATNYQAQVDATTAIEQTNFRDADASSVNTTRLASICAGIAAEIQAELGDDVDGTDAAAVRIGVGLLIVRFNDEFSASPQADSKSREGDLLRQLDTLRQRRVANATTPVVRQPDHADLDCRYPATTWDDNTLEAS